jgi:calcineurin-like phosphoesterase family protein
MAGRAAGRNARNRAAPQVWFTADTHFGHGGAMGRFKRPFSSVREMDDALVAKWNARVRPHDEVWHLGDFGVRIDAARVDALLAALNGRKHLLTGNNDTAATRGALGWSSVTPYVEFTLESVPLVLCHYALRTWNGMYKGAWNLHGHSHGQLAPMTRQVDVGVDVWDFQPVTFAEITQRRRRRSP